MSAPASGSSFILGIRRERSLGIPDLTGSFVWLSPVLPATLGAKRPEGPSGEASPDGFKLPGLPGAIGGEQDLAISMTASGVLEFLENILGGVEGDELEEGVFQYTFVQDRDGVDTSYELVFAHPPTALKGRIYGVKFDSLARDIGNNTNIVARFAAKASHMTRMGQGVQQLGAGTYAAGPILRGPMALKPNAQVLIKIVRTVAGGGLQYKALQSSGAISFGTVFPGPAIDVPYDAEGQSVWHNLQVALVVSGTVTVSAASAAVVGVGTRFTEQLTVGQLLRLGGEEIAIDAITDDTHLTLRANHTAGAAGATLYALNRDAGHWGENRDPMEVIFPGNATEHGDAASGDLWSFAPPGVWDNPVPTLMAGHRHTSAHWFAEWRLVGTTAWKSATPQSGKLSTSWPTSIDQGAGSKYPNSLDRDGISSYTAQLPRKLRDTDFLELQEGHRRIELRMRFEGRQLGTGAYRESIVETYPYCALGDVTRPVGGPGPVIETINLVAEGNPAGDPPVTITVITDRDWTPAS